MRFSSVENLLLLTTGTATLPVALALAVPLALAVVAPLAGQVTIPYYPYIVHSSSGKTPRVFTYDATG
jgi:hypothetical protein